MSALRAYRALLQNGPLTRLLAGEFVSGIGDWLYLVALLIVVYERSEDAVLLGLVGAARVLPYVLLSVPAGIVADRFDRRLVLIVTDTARGSDHGRPGLARRHERPDRGDRRTGDPRDLLLDVLRPDDRCLSAAPWSATSASSVRPTRRGRCSTASRS